MAKQMLLDEFSYLLGADEKFDSGVERGKRLVKVQHTFLLRVKDIIWAEGEDYMMADLCPTGGHYNILRYAKSMVRKLCQEIRNLWEGDEKSISRGDNGEKQTNTKKPDTLENIIKWVVGPLSRRVVTYTEKRVVTYTEKRVVTNTEKPDTLKKIIKRVAELEDVFAMVRDQGVLEDMFAMVRDQGMLEDVFAVVRDQGMLEDVFAVVRDQGMLEDAFAVVRDQNMLDKSV